jgi:D-glycero-alpha-D-manno-heptose-7-phosphate kinase
MSELVDQGLGVLASDRPFSDFGELLYAAWMIKRGLSSKVSSARIDGQYEQVRRAGAVGGKLLGAVGGGFLLLFATPERHPEIFRALSGIRPVSFNFEYTASTLLFYSPDGLSG